VPNDRPDMVGDVRRKGAKQADMHRIGDNCVTLRTDDTSDARAVYRSAGLRHSRVETHDSAASVDGAATGKHFLVEDARGVRWADFHARQGQPFQLLLPSAHRPLFVRDVDGGLESVVDERESAVVLADRRMVRIGMMWRPAMRWCKRSISGWSRPRTEPRHRKSRPITCPGALGYASPSAIVGRRGDDLAGSCLAPLRCRTADIPVSLLDTWHCPMSSYCPGGGTGPDRELDCSERGWRVSAPSSSAHAPGHPAFSTHPAL
jgi:hypothetical protein